MRYLGAVGGTARFASEDIEYRDVLFPTGTLVATSLATANVDPEVWDDPHRLDIERSPAGASHMTLGWGLHHCLGAALARAELQEALPLLARSMPDLERRRRDRVEGRQHRHLGPGPPPAAVHPAARR